MNALQKPKRIENICFVANYGKTFFFHEVASRLACDGITVYWIVVNRQLRDFLIEKYHVDTVLYLSKDDSEDTRDSVGDYRLNELIYGDRTLRHQKEMAYRFLRNIQKPIYNFLKKKNIRMLFGEVTWAHEILIHRLVGSCSDLDAQYLQPHTIRIPVGRFGFFKDEYQSELVFLSRKNSIGHVAGGPMIHLAKPDYLALNDLKLGQQRSFSARLSRLRRFFTMENIDVNDPTLIANRWTSFKTMASQEFNREAYRLVPLVDFSQELASLKFIIYSLHKQPEASIDVAGRYYEDQLTNIINIWRAIPEGWHLFIKEHSNALGDRSWHFYQRLKRLRNVVLIDHNADSHAMVSKSQAVFTVTGTMAYEAALMGIPSFTFGNVFFNRLPNCIKISVEQLRTQGMEQLIESAIQTPITNFSKWLFDHSAEGLIGDHFSNPASMTSENLDLVTGIFELLLHEDQ